MFVLKSTYEELLLKHTAALAELTELRVAWNKLVTRINNKGGENFLRYGTLVRPIVKGQFSQEEIRTLIKLCHPDKHGCSEEATAITAKLL